MNRKELINAVSKDIINYVMSGKINKNILHKKINLKGAKERYEDFEDILNLHFVSQDEVIKFVKILPKHIRSIKTEVSKNKVVSRSIRGNIRWDKTIEERYSRNCKDKSLFVVHNQNIDYDIPENLVLKKAISIIYKIVESSTEILSKDYKWCKDWSNKKGQLIKDIKKIFKRNIHISRIKDPESYRLTQRNLESAKSSRQKIYREAYKIVNFYKKITKDGDKKAIKDLLEKTAIEPEDVDTLFELYVLFEIIKAAEKINKVEPSLMEIKKGKQEIAEFESDNFKLRFYHDKSGPEEIDFLAETDNSKDKLSRYEEIFRQTNEIMHKYFGKKGKKSGRPDIILLEIIKGDFKKYLIVEVKYTQEIKYVRTGVKETLEYLAFLKKNDDYVFEELYNGYDSGEFNKKFFGDGYNGLLVIDELEENYSDLNKITESEPIQIFEATDIKVNLEKLLNKILE